MFRSAFKRNRCLIPVSGYYEWQDTPGGKQPWYFTARDGLPCPDDRRGLWTNGQDKALPLDDHLAAGTHSAADVVAKAQAVLSETRIAAGDVRCLLLSAEHAAE